MEEKVIFGWNHRSLAGLGADRLALGSTRTARYSEGAVKGWGEVRMGPSAGAGGWLGTVGFGRVGKEETDWSSRGLLLLARCGGHI